MNWNRLAEVSASVLVVASGLTAQTRPERREFFISNNGHKLHLSLASACQRRDKAPKVVFEGGLGGGTETWSKVIPSLSHTLCIVTYDRPGLGKSEPDGVSPTPDHIAGVLHAALSKLASPPYLLVGHSWGGPLIRAFAGLYPSEVSGLVFVDPTDFRENALGRRRYVFEPLGHAADGEAIRARIEQYFYRQAGDFAPALQAEIDVSRKARNEDFPSFARLPLPTVPLVILVTTQWPTDLPADLAVPFDSSEYQTNLLNYRLISLNALARSVPDGTLVTTGTSGHYIQTDEPELVIWAIHRVLARSTRHDHLALNLDITY